MASTFEETIQKKYMNKTETKLNQSTVSAAGS